MSFLPQPQIKKSREWPLYPFFSPQILFSRYNEENPTFKYEKNWAPGMHLWGFRRAGIQIWDFWMLKMSDTGNHNESSPIPNSAETVIPKPSKPCVTYQVICERCVYFAVQRIFPWRGLMTRSHPQPSPFGSFWTFSDLWKYSRWRSLESEIVSFVIQMKKDRLYQCAALVPWLNQPIQHF